MEEKEDRLLRLVREAAQPDQAPAKKPPDRRPSNCFFVARNACTTLA